MKNLLKMLTALSFLGLAIYTLYLLYDKFISGSEAENFDDLEDWGYEFDDEEQPEITFAERVKAAAERQIGRIR